MSTGVLITLIIVLGIILLPIIRILAVLLIFGIGVVLVAIGAALWCAISFPIELVKGLIDDRNAAKKRKEYIRKMEENKKIK